MLVGEAYQGHDVNGKVLAAAVFVDVCISRLGQCLAVDVERLMALDGAGEQKAKGTYHLEVVDIFLVTGFLHQVPRGLGTHVWNLAAIEEAILGALCEPVSWFTAVLAGTLKALGSRMSNLATLAALSSERSFDVRIRAFRFVVTLQSEYWFGDQDSRLVTHPFSSQLKQPPVFFLGSGHSRAKCPSSPQLHVL